MVDATRRDRKAGARDPQACEDRSQNTRVSLEFEFQFCCCSLSKPQFPYIQKEIIIVVVAPCQYSGTDITPYLCNPSPTLFGLWWILKKVVIV